MVKLVLVVEARPGLLATSVYPLPAALTDRLLKVAMPFCGVPVHGAPCSPAQDIRASVTGFVAVAPGISAAVLNSDLNSGRNSGPGQSI